MNNPTRQVDLFTQIALDKLANAVYEAAHWQALAMEAQAELAKLRAAQEPKETPAQ